MRWGVCRAVFTALLLFGGATAQAAKSSCAAFFARTEPQILSEAQLGALFSLPPTEFRAAANRDPISLFLSMNAVTDAALYGRIHGANFPNSLWYNQTFLLRLGGILGSAHTAFIPRPAAREGAWNAFLNQRSLEQNSQLPLAAWMRSRGRVAPTDTPTLEEPWFSLYYQQWLGKDSLPAHWSAVFAQVAAIRAHDEQTGFTDQAWLWQDGRRGALLALYGAATEAWLYENARNRIPGPALTVNGQMHADAIDVSFDRGGRLIVESLQETKSSIHGYANGGRKKIRSFLLAMTRPGAVVRLYGHEVPAEHILYRGLDGLLTPEQVRAALFLDRFVQGDDRTSPSPLPQDSDDAHWDTEFVPGFLATFRPSFFRLVLPSNEAALVRANRRYLGSHVGEIVAGRRSFAELRSWFSHFVMEIFADRELSQEAINQMVFVGEDEERNVLLNFNVGRRAPRRPFVPTMTVVDPVFKTGEPSTPVERDERFRNRDYAAVFEATLASHAAWAPLTQKGAEKQRRTLFHLLQHLGFRSLFLPDGSPRPLTFDEGELRINAIGRAMELRIVWEGGRTQRRLERESGVYTLRLPLHDSLSPTFSDAEEVFFNVGLVGHDLHRYSPGVWLRAERVALGEPLVVMKPGQRVEISWFAGRAAALQPTDEPDTGMVLAPPAYGKTIIMAGSIREMLRLPRVTADRGLIITLTGDETVLAQNHTELRLQLLPEQQRSLVPRPLRRPAFSAQAIANLARTENVVLAMTYAELSDLIKRAKPAEWDALRSTLRAVLIDEAQELEDKPDAYPSLQKLVDGQKGILVYGYSAVAIRELLQSRTGPFGGRLRPVYPELAEGRPEEAVLAGQQKAMERGEVTPLLANEQGHVLTHFTPDAIVASLTDEETIQIAEQVRGGVFRLEELADLRTAAAKALVGSLEYPSLSQEARNVAFIALIRILHAQGTLSGQRGFFRVNRRDQARDMETVFRSYAASQGLSSTVHFAVYLHDSSDRERVLEGMRSEDPATSIEWVISCKKLDVGIDALPLAVVVVLGENVDPELLIQVSGRIGRLNVGKPFGQLLQISKVAMVRAEWVNALGRKAEGLARVTVAPLTTSSAALGAAVAGPVRKAVPLPSATPLAAMAYPIPDLVMTTEVANEYRALVAQHQRVLFERQTDPAVARMEQALFARRAFLVAAAALPSVVDTAAYAAKARWVASEMERLSNQMLEGILERGGDVTLKRPFLWAVIASHQRAREVAADLDAHVGKAPNYFLANAVIQLLLIDPELATEMITTPVDDEIPEDWLDRSASLLALTPVQVANRWNEALPRTIEEIAGAVTTLDKWGVNDVDPAINGTFDRFREYLRLRASYAAEIAQHWPNRRLRTSQLQNGRRAYYLDLGVRRSTRFRNALEQILASLRPGDADIVRATAGAHFLLGFADDEGPLALAEIFPGFDYHFAGESDGSALAEVQQELNALKAEITALVRDRLQNPTVETDERVRTRAAAFFRESRLGASLLITSPLGDPASPWFPVEVSAMVCRLASVAAKSTPSTPKEPSYFVYRSPPESFFDVDGIHSFPAPANVEALFPRTLREYRDRLTSADTPTELLQQGARDLFLQWVFAGDAEALRELGSTETSLLFPPSLTRRSLALADANRGRRVVAYWQRLHPNERWNDLISESVLADSIALAYAGMPMKNLRNTMEVLPQRFALAARFGMWESLAKGNVFDFATTEFLKANLEEGKQHLKNIQTFRATTRANDFTEGQLTAWLEGTDAFVFRAWLTGNLTQDGHFQTPWERWNGRAIDQIRAELVRREHDDEVVPSVAWSRSSLPGRKKQTEGMARRAAMLDQLAAKLREPSLSRETLVRRRDAFAYFLVAQHRSEGRMKQEDVVPLLESLVPLFASSVPSPFLRAHTDLATTPAENVFRQLLIRITHSDPALAAWAMVLARDLESSDVPLEVPAGSRLMPVVVAYPFPPAALPLFEKAAGLIPELRARTWQCARAKDSDIERVQTPRIREISLELLDLYQMVLPGDPWPATMKAVFEPLQDANVELVLAWGIATYVENQYPKVAGRSGVQPEPFLWEADAERNPVSYANAASTKKGMLRSQLQGLGRGKAATAGDISSVFEQMQKAQRQQELGEKVRDGTWLTTGEAPTVAPLPIEDVEGAFGTWVVGALGSRPDTHLADLIPAELSFADESISPQEFHEAFLQWASYSFAEVAPRKTELVQKYGSEEANRVLWEELLVRESAFLSLLQKAPDEALPAYDGLTRADFAKRFLTYLRSIATARGTMEMVPYGTAVFEQRNQLASTARRSNPDLQKIFEILPASELEAIRARLIALLASFSAGLAQAGAVPDDRATALRKKALLADPIGGWISNAFQTGNVRYEDLLTSEWFDISPLLDAIHAELEHRSAGETVRFPTIAFAMNDYLVERFGDWDRLRVAVRILQAEGAKAFQAPTAEERRKHQFTWSALAVGAFLTRYEATSAPSVQRGSVLMSPNAGALAGLMTGISDALPNWLELLADAGAGLPSNHPWRATLHSFGIQATAWKTTSVGTQFVAAAPALYEELRQGDPTLFAWAMAAAQTPHDSTANSFADLDQVQTHAVANLAKQTFPLTAGQMQTAVQTLEQQGLWTADAAVQNNPVQAYLQAMHEARWKWAHVRAAYPMLHSLEDGFGLMPVGDRTPLLSEVESELKTAMKMLSALLPDDGALKTIAPTANEGVVEFLNTYLARHYAVLEFHTGFEPTSLQAAAWMVTQQDRWTWETELRKAAEVLFTAAKKWTADEPVDEEMRETATFAAKPWAYFVSRAAQLQSIATVGVTQFLLGEQYLRAADVLRNLSRKDPTIADLRSRDWALAPIARPSAVTGVVPSATRPDQPVDSFYSFQGNVRRLMDVNPRLPPVLKALRFQAELNNKRSLLTASNPYTEEEFTKKYREWLLRAEHFHLRHLDEMLVQRYGLHTSEVAQETYAVIFAELVDLLDRAPEKHAYYVGKRANFLGRHSTLSMLAQAPLLRIPNHDLSNADEKFENAKAQLAKTVFADFSLNWKMVLEARATEELSALLEGVRSARKDRERMEAKLGVRLADLPDPAEKWASARLGWLFTPRAGDTTRALSWAQEVLADHPGENPDEVLEKALEAELEKRR